MESAASCSRSTNMWTREQIEERRKQLELEKSDIEGKRSSSKLDFFDGDDLRDIERNTLCYSLSCVRCERDIAMLDVMEAISDREIWKEKCESKQKKVESLTSRCEELEDENGQLSLALDVKSKEMDAISQQVTILTTKLLKYKEANEEFVKAQEKDQQRISSLEQKISSYQSSVPFVPSTAPSKAESVIRNLPQEHNNSSESDTEYVECPVRKTSRKQKKMTKKAQPKNKRQANMVSSSSKCSSSQVCSTVLEKEFLVDDIEIDDNMMENDGRGSNQPHSPFHAEDHSHVDEGFLEEKRDGDLSHTAKQPLSSISVCEQFTSTVRESKSSKRAPLQPVSANHASNTLVEKDLCSKEKLTLRSGVSNLRQNDLENQPSIADIPVRKRRKLFSSAVPPLASSVSNTTTASTMKSQSSSRSMFGGDLFSGLASLTSSFRAPKLRSTGR